MKFIKINDHEYDVRNSEGDHVGWMRQKPGEGGWGFYIIVYDIDKGRNRETLDYDPAVFAAWDMFRQRNEMTDYERYCRKLFGQLPNEMRAAEASVTLFGRYCWNLKKSDRSLAGALHFVNDWRRRRGMSELAKEETYSVL